MNDYPSAWKGLIMCIASIRQGPSAVKNIQHTTIHLHCSFEAELSLMLQLDLNTHPLFFNSNKDVLYTPCVQWTISNSCHFNVSFASVHFPYANQSWVGLFVMNSDTGEWSPSFSHRTGVVQAGTMYTFLTLPSPWGSFLETEGLHGHPWCSSTRQLGWDHQN